MIRLGGASSLAGLVLVSLALAGSVVWPAAVGLFLYGIGTGAWDVSMNVEGAAVERHLGRTIMPRFHAAFCLGTVARLRDRCGGDRARRTDPRAPARAGRDRARRRWSS